MTGAAAGSAGRVWRWPAGLLAAGFAARVLYLATAAPHRSAAGEIANVAVAFARTGTLADAFRPGQGPTAHVLPLPPVYAGLVYRLLGVRSDAAEAVLAVSAIVLVLAGLALLYRIFGQLGTPRPARLAALAFAALVPLNFATEAIDFRIWEGGLAVALAMGFLTALQDVDGRGVPGVRTIAVMALAAAGVFFVSPPLGLGTYAGSLMMLAGRLPWRRWPATVAIAAAALALVIAPWALRNAVMMGEPIPLRSNAGLELALGNHAAAAAAAPSEERTVFRARLEAIHPFESDAAYTAMQRAGGEAAYARLRGVEARSWIASDPAGFARLCVRHLREFFFPPAWQWNVYSDAGRGTTAKLAMLWAVTALGLAGMIAAMIAAARRYRYAALMLVLPALPYMVTQPVLRYRYIIYGLTVFFAADLLARAWGQFGRAGAGSGAGSWR